MMTPVFKALYAPVKVLGVPPRLIAIEGALSGITLFVFHNIPLLVVIAVVHITVAIIMKKEAEWKTIISFILKMNDSKDEI